MKKKLMCFFLCASMLLSAMASCQKNEEEEEAVADTEEAERVSMTLSLWIPTNEGTTEEAIEQVEAAINKVTQAKYDTAIEFHAIPRDEYQDAVNAHIAEVEKNIADDEAEAESRKKAAKELAEQNKGKTKKETETLAEETVPEKETYVNELGVSLVKYPDVEDTQMDIFLVQGYDNYMEYIDNEQILQLDEELNSTFKVLKSYIFEKYFEFLREDGIYAIPNNHPVGQYDYILLNKELVDTYDYDPARLKSFLTCQDFINDMAYQQKNGAEALKDVTLVLGPVEAANMNYWSVDGEWSLIASQITNAANYDTKLAPKSLLSLSAYTKTVALMKEMTEKGWVGDGIVDEGEKFAVGVMSGDASIKAQYEDEYYVNIFGNPVMNEDDIFGSMFAVSAYTKSLPRSMEIITLLNTNTELRTILQYGAEDVHWEYDRENPDIINVISDDYSMNINETGNVYMTYPAAGVPMSDWDYGKQQNRDCITSPYIKFSTDYITDENREKMEALAELSAEYKARIDAMSAAEFNEQLDVMKEEIKANELVQELLDDKEVTYSPAYLYNEFYADNYE
ncbi:MAG: hypothetical protein E7638_07205 [Ruminococcaceae bacterium]|nr:hypothetical protein [Oscillospiraceae bacterium]